MKERPILFSGSMVRAILSGSKSMTRRIVKGLSADVDQACGMRGEWSFGSGEIKGDPFNFYVDKTMRCPYGAPGDQLWVRETHAIVPKTAYHHDETIPHRESPHAPTVVWSIYAADWERSAPSRWSPSIHMPRWASRITLEITDVRVERLQEISEADAEAEGIERNTHHDGSWSRDDGWVDPSSHEEDFPAESAQSAYRGLWESINGPGSWDRNDWVWVVSFRRVEVADVAREGGPN